MNVTQIEETVKKLASDVLNSLVNKDQFIYELMAAYGHRKTTVSRIKSGERNLAKVVGEVRAKRHIYFKHSDSNEVFSDIDDMKKEPSVTREKIRFIIATDFNQFVAVDTRTNDTLDIKFSELGKHFDFFLPWAGMEKAVYQGDNPADVKAAEKMAKLFDLIKADNFNEENKNDTAALHSLNVFLTRLLFCFFAEDTGIFTDNQFSGELESHTKADGSDVDSYLNRLFKVLNTSKENRHDLPDYLAKFEYVNGGLFADAIASPKFSTKSRRMLIECGSELDWSDINPDIFGSMIQAVVHPDQRGGMGMHYTSVINIMKVIEPLFLDDLYAELENIAENIDLKLKPSRLRKLHDRIANIKIFDPACGSGNFLIIAFKELRKLEMEIIKQLQEFKRADYQDDFFDDVGLDSSFSRIKLSQFYGIELDDFAHEVAILSLWLAEHQMNVEFKAEFGDCEPALPLKESGQIVCANALTINWTRVCQLDKNTFILGNPPYLGYSRQSAIQKEDMEKVFSNSSDFKKLDYISGWFKKAALYVQQNASKAAFVTTNSICQGVQVPILWPDILSECEINFAFTSFKWQNNAKANAAVYVVIIGLRQISEGEKYLYTDGLRTRVKNINGYLKPADNIYVRSLPKSISGLPKMLSGLKAGDDGNLILSEEEKNELLSSYPEANRFIKRYIGASDFMNSVKRYCIWVNDDEKNEAYKIPDFRTRFENLKYFRLNSKKAATQKKADKPYAFDETNLVNSDSIMVPQTGSERRNHLPIGFLDANNVISNGARVIYDAEPWMFGILSSHMHMVWIKAVAGRLKMDMQYSNTLCYNTFPIPEVTAAFKDKLTETVVGILSARENHSDKKLVELYDPDKMPFDLKEAHLKNDAIVEQLFQSQFFENDEQRLECLFALYSKMTGSKNA